MKKLFVLFLIIVSELKLSAQSVGGMTSGSTFFCTTTNSGFISLSGFVGTIQFWESSVDNGLNWSMIVNPTTTQNYSNLNQTTWFRSIVKNGSFPEDTSTISVVTIHPEAVGGNISGGGSFCISAPSGTLNLINNVGQVFKWESSINNGVSWTPITNTTVALPYSVLSQNTMFRAIVQNITVCPMDTSNVASFNISSPSIAGLLTQEDTVCYGSNLDTLEISGNTGNIINWIYTIDSGVNFNPLNNFQSSYTYTNLTQTTEFFVIVKNGACPQDTSNSVKIVVVNASTVSAGPDITITRFESAQLNGSGNGDPVWSPMYEINNPNIFNPIVSPLNTTTYILNLTDRHSCVSVDSIEITVIVPFPTAFTPNEDGVNDYFLIDNIKLFDHNTLQVFNRWGNLVYSASPYKNDWDGKSKNGNDLPDDIYYYTLDYGTLDKPVSGYVLIKR